MSGILDKKSRITDTIITDVGRRQIAEGALDIRYVSYTDAGSFYEFDPVSGSVDATNRVYLEASNLPQDVITLRSNEFGTVDSFSLEQQVYQGRLVSYSLQSVSSSFVDGYKLQYDFLTGEDFLSSVVNVMTSSIDNFKKLRIISSYDDFYEDDQFAIGNKDVTFSIKNDAPLSQQKYVANLTSADTITTSPLHFNLRSLKYLPPVNKITDKSVDKKDYRQTTKQFRLGNYPSWKNPDIGIEDLLQDLKSYEGNFLREIYFDPTSRNNHLHIQCYEHSEQELSKLAILDGGEHQLATKLIRVFYLGKLVLNEVDEYAFMHLFTMVFET